MLVAALLATSSPADAGRRGSRIKYVRSKAKTVEVGRFASARVDCPKRTKVISGGVEMSSADPQGSALVTSVPFDDRDRGKKPDDGWYVVVSNQSIASKTFRAHAVCVRGSKIFYGSTSVDVANGDDANLGIGCPDSNLDSIVGGGGRISAPLHPSHALAATGPTDDFLLGDPDSDPDDFWRVMVDNTSGSPLRLTVHSICERDHAYEYKQFTINNVAGGVGGSTGCDTGEPLVGGGGELSSDPGPGVTVQQSRPSDSVFAPNGVPDNAWFYGMRNDSGSPFNLTITSICRL